MCDAAKFLTRRRYRNLELVTVLMELQDLLRISDLVKEGKYETRSDFIRQAVRLLLEKEEK